MQEEFSALVKNKTWQLVPYLGKENVVDCKWVFKSKFNADGSLKAQKARLVAKGFQQHPMIDFEETFNPILKASTLRFVLTIAVTCGWPIRRLDINNIFSNGYLHKRVLMRQPEGFINPKYPNHICLLTKAL